MRSFAGALACTGAVIGAGFASGREIVAFFSRYGNAGWWLMALAAAAMAGLCVLVLRSAACSGAACWCDLYEECIHEVRNIARRKNYTFASDYSQEDFEQDVIIMIYNKFQSRRGLI